MPQVKKRNAYIQAIDEKFLINPICAILGPRQVGKTTLARQFAEEYFRNDYYFIDLERPEDLALLENPLVAITAIPQTLVVIDEIQRRPELFPLMRVLADQTRGLGDKTLNKKFLILGSASRELIRQSSESLAGRISYLELTPFSCWEIDDTQLLWERGGFPNSYLAPSSDISYQWRLDYIRTFLEQDIPNLGFRIPPPQLRRCWQMLSHYHGQIFNANELARALMLTGQTVRRYLDILTGTFMIRTLHPWTENIAKRQVKSPKIYFRDSGMLLALMGLKNHNELFTSPKLGSLWEGFALEEIVRIFKADPEDCFFWATHAEAELDLLLFKDGKRYGFEIKYTDFPRTTKSMHSALEDLKLDSLTVIYLGSAIFPLTEKITACGFDTLKNGLFKKHFQLSD